MARETIYLRPPAPVRHKNAKPKTAREELGSFLFKYRVQLIPFVCTTWIIACAGMIGPLPFGTLVLGAVGTGAVWLTFQTRYVPPDRVPWFRVDAVRRVPVPEWLTRRVPALKAEQPMERWYAVTCAAVVTWWFVWSTWYNIKPDLRAALAAYLLTALCAAPWWYARRIRGSIAVSFHDLTGNERRLYMEHARQQIKGWTAFTSAAGIHGARLMALTFNHWSITVKLELRSGQTLNFFTTRRLAQLESAFAAVTEVKAGSARVARIERSSRRIQIRFMLEDPHAEPIRPPEDGQDIPEWNRAVIGLFETGEKVVFCLVNTLIAGVSGAGKSGVLNVIIRALARVPNVAIVGIDLKPGAPELSPWKGVMHALASTPAEADEVCRQLRAGLTERGNRMSRMGIRKWVATREEPFIVVIVDELQEASECGLAPKLDKITALLRAYGGCMIVATQHPVTGKSKSDSIRSTMKANLIQRIGLRTETPSADRVIFGDQATAQGWRTSEIDSGREGSFYIRSPLYKVPLLARAYYVDDDDAADCAERWAPARTPVDDATWHPVMRAESGELLDEPAGVLPSGDVVDAVIVDDDPAERILAALRAGVWKPNAIAEYAQMSKANAYRYLKVLLEQGLAENPRRGVWQPAESVSSSSQ